MTLGQAIKLLRQRRGLTLKEVATLTGIAPANVSMIESDKRDPSIERVKALAEIFDVPFIVLMFLASDQSELTDIAPGLSGRLGLLALACLEGKTLSNRVDFADSDLVGRAPDKVDFVGSDLHKFIEKLGVSSSEVEGSLKKSRETLKKSRETLLNEIRLNEIRGRSEGSL